jgi:branched-chain amino acid transport system substrate-binding protein
MRQAVELAIGEATALGGFAFGVELLALDDEASPVKAQELARHVVDDGQVVGVVGHKNSGPSSAAGHIYASAGLVQITQSSTNSDLAQWGWQTFFRVCADNDAQARAAAHYVLDTLAVQRVAAVHDQTEYGRPLAETFVSTIGQGGGEVVTVEAVELGQRVFDETVKRLGGEGCDLVYLGLTEIEASYLTRELRAAGVKALLLGADGSRQSPYPRLTGPAAEGVYGTYAGVDPGSSAEGQAFLRAYKERFGECPIFGAEAYDAAQVLLEALHRAGKPDRSAVLAQVRGMEGLVGATGRISFEPNGNRRDAKVTIWQVQDGHMTLVA